MTVSYTHLDVYKRQHVYRMLVDSITEAVLSWNKDCGWLPKSHLPPVMVLLLYIYFFKEINLFLVVIKNLLADYSLHFVTKFVVSM